MTNKQLAIIREDSCIGCTKCLDVCPTDAILGAEKYMHTVIAAECIGCKLCIPVCPVDCIDLIPWPATLQFPAKEYIIERSKQKKLRLNLAEKTLSTTQDARQKRKQYISEALIRAEQKKSV